MINEPVSLLLCPFFGSSVTDDVAEELEGQVARLTADKASLENENKLLKAIVLGSGTTQGQETLQAAIAAVGAKRKRE